MQIKEALAIPFYHWQLGLANLLAVLLVAVVALLK